LERPTKSYSTGFEKLLNKNETALGQFAEKAKAFADSNLDILSLEGFEGFHGKLKELIESTDKKIELGISVSADSLDEDFKSISDGFIAKKKEIGVALSGMFDEAKRQWDEIDSLEMQLAILDPEIDKVAFDDLTKKLQEAKRNFEALHNKIDAHPLLFIDEKAVKRSKDLLEQQWKTSENVMAKRQAHSEAFVKAARAETDAINKALGALESKAGVLQAGLSFDPDGNIEEQIRNMDGFSNAIIRANEAKTIQGRTFQTWIATIKQADGHTRKLVIAHDQFDNSVRVLDKHLSSRQDVGVSGLLQDLDTLKKTWSDIDSLEMQLLDPDIDRDTIAKLTKELNYLQSTYIALLTKVEADPLSVIDDGVAKKVNEQYESIAKTAEAVQKKRAAIAKAKADAIAALESKAGVLQKLDGVELRFNADSSIEDQIRQMEGLKGATVKATKEVEIQGQKFQTWTAKVQNANGTFDEYKIFQNTLDRTIRKATLGISGQADTIERANGLLETFNAFEANEINLLGADGFEEILSDFNLLKKMLEEDIKIGNVSPASIDAFNKAFGQIGTDFADTKQAGIATVIDTFNEIKDVQDKIASSEIKLAKIDFDKNYKAATLYMDKISKLEDRLIELYKTMDNNPYEQEAEVIAKSNEVRKHKEKTLEAVSEAYANASDAAVEAHNKMQAARDKFELDGVLKQIGELETKWRKIDKLKHDIAKLDPNVHQGLIADLTKELGDLQDEYIASLNVIIANPLTDAMSGDKTAINGVIDLTKQREQTEISLKNAQTKRSEEFIAWKEKEERAIEATDRKAAEALNRQAGVLEVGFQFNADGNIEDQIRQMRGFENAIISASKQKEIQGQVFQSYTVKVKQANGQIETFIVNQNKADNSVRVLNKGLSTVSNGFAGLAKRIAGMMGLSMLMYAPIRATRDSIRVLREVDTSLTELSKVTNIAREDFQQLGIEALETASRFGRSAQDMLTAYKYRSFDVNPIAQGCVA